MYNRRNFLKNAGAASVAGILLSNMPGTSYFEDVQKHPLGLQLYTFFNIIDDDVQGTLKKIAAIGYKEIESAFSKKGGYYGMRPKEFNAYLSSMGLAWKSHHVLGAPFKLPPGAKMPTGADGKPITIPLMANLKYDMQRLVDEAAEGEVKWLVCASTPINTLDDINSSLEVLNKTGEACKKANIGFAYHNHDAEFRAVESKVPYEMFLSQLDPEAVKFELDLAWAIKGGADPVALFEKHPGRFPLWHVKDIDLTHQNVLPVGSGTIDFKRIFASASKAGMQHIFVEHDMPKDAYASITSSYQYLTNIIKV